MNTADAIKSLDTSPVQQAFDQAAPTYESDWSESIIGRLQRQAVWRVIDPLFTSGDRILDIGCGTGTDAFHLAERGIRVHAIDVSPAMIEQVQKGIDQRGRRVAQGSSASGPPVIAIQDGEAASVTTEVRAIEDLDQLTPEQPFDGAISNFSPFNCVEDLDLVADSPARLIRPGGKLILCVMTRFCLWETLWYPLTMHLYKAARRWGSKNVTATVSSSGEFDVYYPSAREIEVVLSEHFRRIGDQGVGIFVPPSYLEPWAQKFPRTVSALGAIDRVINRWPFFRAVGDHRLLTFERR